MNTQPHRSRVEIDGVAVVLVDSITQIVVEDAGRVVITGSHGGISAAAFAAAVPAALYIFNDAGIGKDKAGIAGLDLLQTHGIAAVAVSHDSARIGEARDTLENGVVTALNARAAAMGVEAGMTVRALPRLAAC